MKYLSIVILCLCLLLAGCEEGTVPTEQAQPTVSESAAAQKEIPELIPNQGPPEIEDPSPVEPTTEKAER